MGDASAPVSFSGNHVASARLDQRKIRPGNLVALQGPNKNVESFQRLELMLPKQQRRGAHDSTAHMTQGRSQSSSCKVVIEQLREEPFTVQFQKW